MSRWPYPAFLGVALVSSVPLTAQGTRVNAPVVPGGDVGQWQIAKDGARVFYAASQTTVALEIHDVPLDGSQATRVLSAPLAPGRSCSSVTSTSAFQVSPDESRVAYLADQDTNDVWELYVVPADGSRVSTKVSGTMPVGGNVQFDYRWSVDGARLLFRIHTIQDGLARLYSAPADGSAPPVLLHLVHSFAVGQHADRVVFRDAGQIYSAPVDGSSPATALSSPPQIEFTQTYTITPDGGTVVFSGGVVGFDPVAGADFMDNGLYAVPIDGSTAPIEIMPPIRSTAPFLPPPPPDVVVTPDSQHVVARFGENLRLYATRVDGQGPVLDLNDFGFANHTESFRLEPSSERVAYLAVTNAPGVGTRGICSARLDGSAPPLSLAASSPPGYVLKPEVDPLGRVVFGRKLGDITMLLGMPLDGSQPPVVLSGTMVPGGQLQGVSLVDHNPGWWIDPTGRYVVYKADQDIDEVVELYCAPIAGNRPAVKVSGPMVAGGDAFTVQFTPDGRLVYNADQEVNGTNELFMSAYAPSLGTPGAHAHVPAPAGSAVRTVP